MKYPINKELEELQKYFENIEPIKELNKCKVELLLDKINDDYRLKMESEYREYDDDDACNGLINHYLLK